ncbi:MAG: hypothetical protein AOA66_0827 [Candidatus Bathyarchaeota archaeon BA2]|nr:MAG: hypothetical protein AOA66_0827 [Candidatus Bathyarchaeota archaeon BA2]
MVPELGWRNRSPDLRHFKRDIGPEKIGKKLICFLEKVHHWSVFDFFVHFDSAVPE